MSFNVEEGTIKIKKLKFFLILSLFLLFIILIDFFIRSAMNVSNFYDFKNFENKSDCRNISLSKNVFVSNKILSLNFRESCYSLLSDNLVSYSDYYYVLLNSSESSKDYSVFSVKNNKFLFTLKLKDFVFVINNLIFTLNNLYKTLEVYDSSGNNILILNFLSSILSVDYNNEVLVLGLSNGEIYIYKQGKIIYMENFLERKFPTCFVKLSSDNKYLVSLKGNSEYFLEIIDLENNYKKILELNNLTINSFETFLKIDDYHNLFIEGKNSFMVINIKNGKIFKVENKNSILRTSYDYFQNVYRVYFYSESEKIINIKTYSANSFKLFDNIFIKDEISSFVEFGKGLLYFNSNNDLKYLGLAQ